MITRPKEFNRTGERITEQVNLKTGEDKQALYKAWLAGKRLKQSCCTKHPTVPLVFDPEHSDVWSVHEDTYGQNWRIVPDAWQFVAAFRCPACSAAYALCPPEFHEMSFQTFNTSTPERVKALSVCREFVAQVNKRECGFALLVGRTGNGKTLLASLISREVKTRDALYVRQGQLTCALRAAYNHKEVVLRRGGSDEDEAETPPTVLEIVQQVRFLVLDEIGCHSLANDERLLLDELIKHRYEQNKPTILISNLALDQLKEFLGDAPSDRIACATGNGKFVLQFSGESYRRTVKEDYLSGLNRSPNTVSSVAGGKSTP